jgi:hypothetical protein
MSPTLSVRKDLSCGVLLTSLRMVWSERKNNPKGDEDEAK